ncbi:MAG TPA: glycosyltransferase, partial [Terriglobales bacterium]|nr:glycosyltransferase [Terriglobales bacterium]
FLRQRIDSILAQTFQDFELILLDDASTDDSRSILSSYSANPHVTAVQFNEKNSGSTFKQWNKGVRLARGEYIWMAESDDYADPRLLEALVPRLDSDRAAVLAQCRTWRVSADGTLMGYQDGGSAHIGSDRWTGDFRANGAEECRKYLRCFPVQNASSIVFRRDVYWQVGGADETLRQVGDWKTWVSMALTGGTILYVAEPLNYRRNHDASVTARNLVNLQDGVWVLEHLRVTPWLLKKLTPDSEALESWRRSLASMWVPIVLGWQTPGRLRRAILRRAASADPHAFRRLAQAAYTKFYYDLLELTYAPRHALGLCRRRPEGIGPGESKKTGSVNP